jgi:DNA-binding transcriptional LysR family regulator
VLESVANGSADFGLNFIGAQEVGIDFKAIQKEPYVLALRKDHPLASQTSVTWSELAHERLIALSERSGNRAMIDHALARVHARPEVFCQAKHVSGALGMVAAGLGVSIVPLLSVSTYLHPALTSVAITHPVVSRTIGIISRKGNVLPPAAAALHEIVRKAAASKRAP